ncbi:MAG: hypothetical protein BGN88_14815 [Clostridiales bacterium 43-6]|nr:MAG: hypothetical protein BGN88_14815 [Clostridiales bacterium 43-6]
MLKNGVIYSGANDHVDLNRCFPYNVSGGFAQNTGRYQTGPNAMMAREALALNDLIQKCKNKSGRKIFIDNHGWLQQIFTNSEPLRSKFRLKFNSGKFANKNTLEDNAIGFVSRWANVNGYESCLFEFPVDVAKWGDIKAKGYETKYIDVIKDIINNMAR